MSCVAMSCVAMSRVVTSRFALPAAAALLLSISTPSKAQTFFEAPRDFVLDRQCDAYRSFKTRSGATPLEAGARYVGRGLNRPDNATHAFIRVGEQSLWVDLACGHFADGDGARPGGAPGVVLGPLPGRREVREPVCLPFFDDVDNPVPRALGYGGNADITPPPPPLDAFDKAVLDVCGPPGKQVSRDEFVSLMRANPDVLGRIRSFTSSHVFADRPQRSSGEAYLADLADAWIGVAAFDHIMCGQPGEKGRIGGLHFAGRFLQLQQSGEACRMTNYTQNEVEPGLVYTFGVRMKGANGQWFRHATKGYGYTLSAEEIIKAATRALSENAAAGSDSEACLLTLEDDGKGMSVVFVRRAEGIRTFYTDATPNGRGDKLSPPCAAPVALP